MKRLVLLLLAVSLMLTVCACSNDTAQSSSIAANSSTASAAVSTGDTSSEATFTLTVPTEHDAVAKSVHMFLDKVKDYDLSDFNTTENSILQAGTAPIPLTVKWSASDSFKTEKVTVYLSESSDMSNAVEYDATSSKALSIENIKTGITYYVRAVATAGDKTEQTEIYPVKIAAGPRVFNPSGMGINNLRDIGGWTTTDGKTVKQGLVYRSGEFDKLTDKGRAVLTALGIKTDLDFRRQGDEVASEFKNRSPIGENVNYISIETAAYFYGLFNSQTAEAVRKFADLNNYPILFHCAAGADRTGTMGLIISSLLGVDDRWLIADYELTTARSRAYKGNGSDTDGFYSLWSAVQSRKGNTTQEKLYTAMSSLGVTDMEMSNIYNIMMTDSAVFDASSLSKQSAENGKLTYKLIMRESKSVSKVEIDGNSAKFTLSGDTLTVNASDSGVGIITLDDGAVLRFKF